MTAPPLRACLTCGDPIPYAAKGMSTHVQRKFCSRACTYSFPRGPQPFLQDGVLVKDCSRTDCEEQNPQPVANFKRKRTSASGYQSGCKGCARRWWAGWRIKNRSRRQSPEYFRTRTLAKYCLTSDDYDRLLEHQDGGCGICGVSPTANEDGTFQSFHVDHDHACCPGDKSCGACVRGLLCSRCNQAIGLLDDNETKIRSALVYLQSPPRSRLLGVDSTDVESE